MSASYIVKHFCNYPLISKTYTFVQAAAPQYEMMISANAMSRLIWHTRKRNVK